MKKIMKVTAILNIIFGAHYLAIAIIALFATGFTALVSIATFSLSIIGGTLGLILTLVLYLGLTLVYGLGGIYTLKSEKKKALICMVIATAVSLISLVIGIANPKVAVTFIDVMALMLPIANAFLIIQTTE